jgi:hypothetical protein
MTGIWMVMIAIIVIPSACYSQTFFESDIGDAPEFPGEGYATVSNGITYNRIVGNALAGVDSWLITVTNASTFFIEDVTPSDTAAFVWDVDGNPLFSNDDTTSFFEFFGFGFGHGGNHAGTLIGMPAVLQDGDQIVLTVGGFGGDPQDDTGKPIFLPDGEDYEALCGPDPNARPFFWYPGNGDIYEIELTGAVFGSSVLVGDVNQDGLVNLLDVNPFVDRITTGKFQAEADINGDGVVNLLDVEPFVALLTG